jgi:predicted DNA-binding transcriptional regulator YafY
MSSNNQLTFALEILRLLAEKPRKRSELGDLLTQFLEEQKQSTGDITQKLDRTIRKLRDCGFEIDCAPSYPYELKQSNFPVILSNEQKEALYLATKLLSQLGFFSPAEQLGRIYQFPKDYQPSNLQADFSPPVDYSSEKISKTIKQLEERIAKKCRYTIRYFSKSTGDEKLYDLDRSELRLHNGVLYLFAFVPDWKSSRFQDIPNIDQNRLFHIKRIQNVGPSSYTQWFYDFPTLTFRYRMSGPLANYEPRRSQERIIEINTEKKYIDIETTEDYLFWFRQRILQYGQNVQILTPQWLRVEIKKELYNAWKNYS